MKALLIALLVPSLLSAEEKCVFCPGLPPGYEAILRNENLKANTDLARALTRRENLDLWNAPVRGGNNLYLPPPSEYRIPPIVITPPAEHRGLNFNDPRLRRGW